MPESAPKPVCLLLPGTDGTGVFFNDLALYLQPHADVRILTYPRDQALGYEALCQYLLPHIPTDGEYVLIAESFAGPLAIFLAHTAVNRPSKIVLAASFYKAPWKVPPLVLRLPLSAIGWIRPPEWLIAFLLLSPRNKHLSKQIATTIQSIEPEVLKHRLKAVMTCDLTSLVKKLDIPVLYLRGKRDRLIPESCAKAFARLNSKVTVVSIDATHFVLQGNVPRLCEDILIPFVKTI